MKVILIVSTNCIENPFVGATKQHLRVIIGLINETLNGPPKVLTVMAFDVSLPLAFAIMALATAPVPQARFHPPHHVHKFLTPSLPLSKR